MGRQTPAGPVVFTARTMRSSYSGRLRHVAWIVAFGAAAAAVIPRRADPESDRRSALAHALDKRGIVTTPEDCDWLERPGAPLGGAARAIVRGAPAKVSPTTSSWSRRGSRPRACSSRWGRLQPHRDQQRGRSPARHPRRAHRVRDAPAPRGGGLDRPRDRSRRPAGAGDRGLDTPRARAERDLQRAIDGAAPRRGQAHLRHRDGREEGRDRPPPRPGRRRPRPRATSPSGSRAARSRYPLGARAATLPLDKAGTVPGWIRTESPRAEPAGQRRDLGRRSRAQRGRRRRHADREGRGPSRRSISCSATRRASPATRAPRASPRISVPTSSAPGGAQHPGRSRIWLAARPLEGPGGPRPRRRGAVEPARQGPLRSARTRASPPAFLTHVHPHRSPRKATRVYISLWDPRQVELHMMAGTVEPKAPPARPASARSRARPRC